MNFIKQVLTIMATSATLSVTVSNMVMCMFAIIDELLFATTAFLCISILFIIVLSCLKKYTVALETHNKYLNVIFVTNGVASFSQTVISLHVIAAILDYVSHDKYKVLIEMVGFSSSYSIHENKMLSLMVCTTIVVHTISAVTVFIKTMNPCRENNDVNESNDDYENDVTNSNLINTDEGDIYDNDGLLNNDSVQESKDKHYNNLSEEEYVANTSV